MKQNRTKHFTNCLIECYYLKREVERDCCNCLSQRNVVIMLTRIVSDGKVFPCKFFRIGNAQVTNNVGVFLAEDLIDKVNDINCVSDRIVLIKMSICDGILTVFSVYSPQLILSTP